MSNREKLLRISGKLAIGIIFTLLCNLIMDSNIRSDNLWPEDIFPYVFLILNCFVIFQTDFKELFEWILKDKNKVRCGVLVVFLILLQCIILHIDLTGNVIFLIKTGIKALIFGSMTAVVFIMCAYKVVVKKVIPTIPFSLGTLVGILYFYIIRLKGSYSIYPLLLMMLIYLTGEDADVSRRERRIKEIGAVILALFETLGYAIITYKEHPEGFHPVLILIGVGVWAFVFYYVENALLAMIDKWTDSDRIKERTLSGWKLYGIFISMLSLRLLIWINWFPGMVSPDTINQINQALGNLPYSNHHPWIHTLLIKLCMSIGISVFGSTQAGVAVTSFISMVVSSLILLVALKYFYYDTPVSIWRLAAILYVVDPMHWMYAITIWKDVLFAYTLVAYCLLLIIMDRLKGEIKPHIWILYVMLSFLFCFARTNGLYVWIFTVPFILWHYRKNVRPWLVSTTVCFLLIVSYKGFVLPHFQVTPPDTVESLSIPLQQIAYTVQNEGVFSEHDKSVITNIVDMESLGDAYSPNISDPVKNLIRADGNQDYITENKVSVITMYLSVGVKNPEDYIVAFLNQSRGYWYHKLTQGLFMTGVYGDVGELVIYRDPLFPPDISQWLDQLLEIYNTVWHYLWSLALCTYVVVILFVYCLTRKKPCFNFIPVIGIFLTLVIATPVFAEFRYAYGIYLILPEMLLQVGTKSEC